MKDFSEELELVVRVLGPSQSTVSVLGSNGDEVSLILILGRGSITTPWATSDHVMG
jgi:hypothetical protein